MTLPYKNKKDKAAQMRRWRLDRKKQIQAMKEELESLRRVVAQSPVSGSGRATGHILGKPPKKTKKG